MMHLRPFLINDDIRARIDQLVAYAEAHPFTMDELRKILSGKAAAPGDRSEFVMHIPVGYRLVLSIERQDAGRVRHLSVSVDRHDALPSIYVLKGLMQLTGFKDGLEHCGIYTEDLPDGRRAINVLELMHL